jgi:hypothetical protein
MSNTFHFVLFMAILCPLVTSAVGFFWGRYLGIRTERDRVMRIFGSAAGVLSSPTVTIVRECVFGSINDETMRSELKAYMEEKKQRHSFGGNTNAQAQTSM